MLFLKTQTIVDFATCLDYSKGFGGKYGVQKDRQDKTAVGYDYEGKTEQHASTKGFIFDPSVYQSCLPLFSLF